MRTGSRRLAAIARVAAVAALALTLATPASAQFGGLKKKLKSAAAQEGVEKVVPEAAAPVENAAAPTANAPATGGTLVLDDEMVEHLVTGLKAAVKEKEKAKMEDTPYGRHIRGVAAYEEAQPKCGAAQTTFGTRMAGNQKLNDRYSMLVDKMVQAGTRQDQAGYVAYSDSAAIMIDPACAVKKPNQPSGYYEDLRKIDEVAEQKALKESGLNRREYALGLERVEMVLRDAPSADISTSEKNAVEKRSKELKKLLGIQEVRAATRAAPAAVETAPPAPPAQPVPTVSPAQQAMGMCYAQNAQKNEARLVELGNRGEAAQKANDTATMMAIADTINRIQSAGCTPGQ